MTRPNFMGKTATYDAVVIGGGMYGCVIALHLRKELGSVLVIEREKDILMRASAINQARIHNGYHYPRSLMTAKRSHDNFEQFVEDYNEAVVDGFTKLYAVAKDNSKVNAQQFEIFCRQVGIPLREPHERRNQLFSPDYVEKVYEVDEVAFDSDRLRKLLKERLRRKKVEIMKSTTAKKFVPTAKGISIVLEDGSRIRTNYCFNCSYANINQLLENSQLPALPLKHEMAEMALFKAPNSIAKIGITIVDGPFFSFMPFPTRSLHTLSHVRYTPHAEWKMPHENDISGNNFDLTQFDSHYMHMLHDAQRFVPELAKAHYEGSLYEVKTLLQENEIDDGRPILLRRDYAGIRNLFIVMGGKIDNIYDILLALDEG